MKRRSFFAAVGAGLAVLGTKVCDIPNTDTDNEPTFIGREGKKGSDYKEWYYEGKYLVGSGPIVKCWQA